MSDFLMPMLGAGMESGTLVKWLRAPGDRVERGDIVAEVETEKGLIEIEVFESGVIEAIVVPEGTKVPVGAVLARIGSGAPKKEAHATGGTPGARQLAREAEVPLYAISGTGPHGTITRADVAREIDARKPIETARVEVRPAPAETERAEMPATRGKKISPLARRRARELGIDPANVAAGPDGVVHAADVERARRPDKQSAMRRAIAVAMAKSKREIPHYYVSTTIDLGAAMAWLAKTNAERPVTERLLPAALLLRAVVLALGEVPELNAHWTGESAPPIPEIHLGVAISLRGGGLIAPAVRGAEKLSLVELMRALSDLVQRARTGGLRGSELSDPTITVTNLGERGVDAVFPIIHPPQVAMIGLGKIVERPWVVEGELRARPVITASLAADHRVTDGHRGGIFLTALGEHLSHPEQL